jgi:hypothetical protein
MAERAEDERLIQSLQKKFASSPRQEGGVIFNDPEYITSKRSIKVEFFRRVIVGNPNYISANEATRLEIESKFGVTHSELSVPMETRDAARVRILLECSKAMRQ